MKKYFLILVLALFFITCKDADDSGELPGTWIQLQNFPGDASSKGITFSLLGKGYYGLGGHTPSDYVRDIWAYDPETDSWEQKNDFPFELTVEVSLSINDKGYVLTQSGNLYVYDPLLDTWNFLSTSPLGNRFALTAFALGGKGYFGTGVNTLPDENNNYPILKDFWKYDPAKNEWFQINNFPGEARTNAISFVVGDRAYVGLGFERQAPPIFKDIYSYNPGTGDWDRMADFPTSSAIVGIQFSSDSKGYVGVTENNATHLGQVFEYSPAEDTWRKVKTFPSGNSVETRSFLLNNRMFVVGGWFEDYSRQVWEFIL